MRSHSLLAVSKEHNFHGNGGYLQSSSFCLVLKISPEQGKKVIHFGLEFLLHHPFLRLAVV